MQEIIKWLRNFEHSANEVYSKAAEYFKHDREFSKFLSRTADDEAWHYHVMVSAAEHFRENNFPPPPITIDTDTKQKVESLFHQIDQKLTDRTLSKGELLDFLIKAEFSEWNDMFLYVVNTLKDRFKEFSYAAIKIQNHKRIIENFFEEFFDNKKKLIEFKKAPAVWNEKILIVEDDKPIAELLKAILDDEGEIEIVYNGLKGLEKVTDTYYKLIISDVDMPVMDGLEFFEQACRLHPNIGERFLFFTGMPSEERTTFFRKHDLEFITKPSDIDVIQKKAINILLKETKEVMKDKFA